MPSKSNAYISPTTPKKKVKVKVAKSPVKEHLSVFEKNIQKNKEQGQSSIPFRNASLAEAPERPVVKKVKKSEKKTKSTKSSGKKSSLKKEKSPTKERVKVKRKKKTKLPDGPPLHNGTDDIVDKSPVSSPKKTANKKKQYSLMQYMAAGTIQKATRQYLQKKSTASTTSTAETVATSLTEQPEPPTQEELQEERLNHLRKQVEELQLQLDQHPEDTKQEIGRMKKEWRKKQKDHARWFDEQHPKDPHGHYSSMVKTAKSLKVQTDHFRSDNATLRQYQVQLKKDGLDLKEENEQLEKEISKLEEHNSFLQDYYVSKLEKEHAELQDTHQQLRRFAIPMWKDALLQNNISGRSEQRQHEIFKAVCQRIVEAVPEGSALQAELRGYLVNAEARVQEGYDKYQDREFVESEFEESELVVASTNDQKDEEENRVEEEAGALLEHEDDGNDDSEYEDNDGEDSEHEESSEHGDSEQVVWNDEQNDEEENRVDEETNADAS